MAHITVPPNAPGIVGPLLAYPNTEKHLSALAHTLLQSAESLSPGERELIATHVSNGNECYFCTQSHAAAARHHLGEAAGDVDAVLAQGADAPVGERMAALLAIAGKVRVDGRSVTDADVARARAAGANDHAIHDTVLIAAAFCMFNRYVEGLGTWAPQDPEVYRAMGARTATMGYVRDRRAENTAAAQVEHSTPG